MGTRASFFINDPQDLEKRQWLGCIAFDGYPDGDCGVLAECSTEESFRAVVQRLAHDRDDFCDPATHGFPFPWQDDLFLTDYTYAWMDGKVMATAFHHGWMPLRDHLTPGPTLEAYDARDSEELPSDVPAPAKYDPRAPDSIMIIRA